MLFRFVRNVGASVAILFVFCSPAQSALVPIGISDFDPGATTFDFDTVPTGVLSDPSAFPDFSLSDFESFAVLEDGSGWGGGADPGRNTLDSVGLTVSFADAITQFGLVFGGNTTNLVDIEFFSGAASVGTATLSSSFDDNWIFYGFEEVAGFDRIVFSPESTNDWVYGAYDFIYTAAAVPEPTTLALLGLGLLGVGYRRRR